MTQTNSNLKKATSGAAGKAPAKRANATGAAKAKQSVKSKKLERDPYDDFLESAERAERADRQKKSASGQKNAGKRSAVSSEAGKSTGAPQKKKTERQGDLLMAWEELEKEAKLNRDARQGARQSRTRSQSEKTSGQRPPSPKQTNQRASSQKTSSRRPAQRTGASAKGGGGRDEYDAFLAKTERGRSPQRKRSGNIGATVALLVLIGCMLGLAGWQYTQYQKFLTMKAAVDRASFYEGTTVEGVNVASMTLEQALEYWETDIEPGYAQRTVTLNNGATFTAAELGYSSDYASVLTVAWSAGRSGSLEERYQALSLRRDQPSSYNVTRTMYSTEVIAQCASAVAAQIDRPAENAHIESFDTSSYKFVLADEVIGSRLDQDRLAQDMAAALDAGGGSVELIVNSIQPEVKKDDVSSEYGMISSATTNASSSSSNRLANIKLATQLINGTCLKPGETFSFNGVVGERTKQRGFKTAAAYSGGKVVEDVGGGICQVSTTLFNAAVKADLEIVERHNHSLTVGYVDKGKDAAVDWGNLDLQFTNNTDDNVYICCYVTDDKRVRFGIFGKLLPNGESITVEGVTTGKVSYETVMRANTALASGQTQVVQSGKVGYRAEAYKIRWDADGNQISRELLCKSTYRATDEIIEYGP